jgi:hypothetical protein
MPATVVLPVTSLLYAVDSTSSFVVLSSSASSTNDAGTVTSLVTASQILVGTGLWIEQELMKVQEVLSDPIGVKYRVQRGQGGSSSQPHSSMVHVTIGSLDKFYTRDPKGRPSEAVLVSPWINTVSGRVWFPQGDSLSVSERYWQEVTNTYGIGPLGIRTESSSPAYGT